MGELSAADRHDLITEYIDKAKINWAHISIAQLMRAGYVDRVLTTNFDPLVTRACALLNLYPAVYDMAVVRKDFVADFVRDLAVFHLHGQRDGFVQLHNEEEVNPLAEAIEPAVRRHCPRPLLARRRLHRRQRSGLSRPGGSAALPQPFVLGGFPDEKPSDEVKKALLEATRTSTGSRLRCRQLPLPAGLPARLLPARLLRQAVQPPAGVHSAAWPAFACPDRSRPRLGGARPWMDREGDRDI